VPPSDDPELIEVFGPTLVAIAARRAKEQVERKSLTESKTYKRLGYEPISLDDGLTRTIDWFREIGKIS
jgi:nucleoside-diphosphate-sugar epimerase